MSQDNKNSKQIMMMPGTYSRYDNKRCIRRKRKFNFLNQRNASNRSSVLFMQGEINQFKF